MPSLPLDHVDGGVFLRLAAQPYPLRPAGIFVSERVFEASMSVWTPTVAAAVYLVAVRWANQRRARAIDAGKPLPDLIKPNKRLSQLVLLHNAFLAVFSAWSFYHAVTHIIPYFLNGIQQGGSHGFRNAYCTVPTNDPAGLGRYVWFFYMSKYYEIVDSVILAAKGKKVSNLQAYHHAGAIAAMWSGTRYSANAVWIFLLFNSGIHTMMYSYYTLSTLRVPGASALKRAMTTAQIAQLFFGCIIASLYLLVRYSPVAFQGAAPSVGATPLVDSARGAFTYTWDAVTTSHGAADAYHRLRELVMHHDARLSCCVSTGQIFAVALNVVYLIPLIVLFVRFYLRSYLKSAAKGSKAQ